MILCILSDSHGNLDILDQLLEQLRMNNIHPDAFLHAGDFARDSEHLRLQTGLPVYTVAGNCDARVANCLYKPDEFIQLKDHLLWMTHGHRYIQTHSDTEQLIEQAQIFEADIVVYGHTHQPNITRAGQLLLLNPGSIALPRNSNCSYAIVHINGDNINTDIYEIY